MKNWRQQRVWCKGTNSAKIYNKMGRTIFSSVFPAINFNVDVLTPGWDWTLGSSSVRHWRSARWPLSLRWFSAPTKHCPTAMSNINSQQTRPHSTPVFVYFRFVSAEMIEDWGVFNKNSAFRRGNSSWFGMPVASALELTSVIRAFTSIKIPTCASATLSETQIRRHSP